jgi:1-acyl-sn-glycerol-3-phosphate acyltransferase
VPVSSPPDNLWLRYARRLVTVPLYLALTALVTALAPLVAPLCWLVSFRRGSRGALRSFVFVGMYLWCESIGIVVSFWLWLRHGLPTRRGGERWRRFLDGNFVLQCWWANALKVGAQRLFSLRFVVEGAQALDGAAVIMLPRHVSIADTIIPMVFYAIPKQIRLRYVLKRELLLDPCLDIVGNRLPNCFVARSGADAQADIDRVTVLARDLGADEGFLIYPEGTRFSAERRRRVLEGFVSRVGAADLERMRAWTELLPPRPGGATALIRAAPDLDLVFCAHTGFEGASHVRHLINGSWIGADIRIRFWRVDRRDVPADEAAQRAFLFTQWDRMQDTVVALQQRTAGAEADEWTKAPSIETRGPI